MNEKISASTLVGPLLQAFFAEHLLTHKRVSSQTVDSYRDTFRLLLESSSSAHRQGAIRFTHN